MVLCFSACLFKGPSHFDYKIWENTGFSWEFQGKSVVSKGTYGFCGPFHYKCDGTLRDAWLVSCMAGFTTEYGMNGGRKHTFLIQNKVVNPKNINKPGSMTSCKGCAKTSLSNRAKNL